jgi:nickel-dependent lactate racemase
MMYFSSGSGNSVIGKEELMSAINKALEQIGTRNKILIIPPDFTRYHSMAGLVTELIYKYYGERISDILPALGTHSPMMYAQTSEMYGSIPVGLFRVHNWRNDIFTSGVVPGSFISTLTENRLDYSWPAQLNKLVVKGGHDLIISVGQVVPHEVVGMAGYNKNLFIGTGGTESINKSHFIGAVYGMERIMGKTETPVRKLLNYASRNFISSLPVVYIQTVISRDENGSQVLRGLYIGDDESVFTEAAKLSLMVNFSILDRPLKKVVVYLDPSEYKSTWLGNKSIYRTRMAMADEGELIVLAPGLSEFGEDPEIDRLIRKYGYRGTQETLSSVSVDMDLGANLSAAAHLIHGSTEGRFSVTYCPGKLSREEIESVNFGYADLKEMIAYYNPAILREGTNILPGGEEIFFISNPALGLWASKERMI